jgi:chitodextrinase
MKQFPFANIKKKQMMNVFFALVSISFMFFSPLALADNPLWICPGGPYEGTAGQNIHFYLDIHGGMVPYYVSWDFGDGGTSTVRFADHVYVKAGNYSVKVVVTDGAGDKVIGYTPVTIYNLLDVDIITSPPYFIHEVNEIGIAIQGGKPPYEQYWDTDDDGSYDDAVGETTQISWDAVGSYVIALKVIDNRDSIAYASASITVIVRNEEPLIPSRPMGQSNGKAGQSYAFTTSTEDPNDDNVYYRWDWGDGNFSEWMGPYPSNATCQAEHNWQEQGQYAIRVMAKDTIGAESAWSEQFVVSMPRHQYSLESCIMRLVSFLFERYAWIYH